MDRNRLQALQHSITMLVVRSSPVQQFGFGLGIGWYDSFNNSVHINLKIYGRD